MTGCSLEGVLGQGRFGVVLRARRLLDQRMVAIKLARAEVPTAVAQLAREAEALQAIGPPGAPLLYDKGVLPSGTPYLVLDLIPLPSLATRLAELPAGMDPIEFSARVFPLLSALAAVHACGHAHGDLKPENILSGQVPPQACLLDFGLSVALDHGAQLPEVAGSLAGTIEYMSPEQCASQCSPDVQTDIYAIGAICYEMLAGRPPFWGSLSEVRQAHADRRVPRLSESAPVAPAVERVVLRCLAKERDRRYARVEDVRAALSEALGAAPALSGTAQATGQPRGLKGSTAQSRGSIGLVFFCTDEPPPTLQAALASCGGQLAYIAGRHCVAGFSQESGDNPVGRALQAAHAILKRGLAERAIIDLAVVAIQRRTNGSARYISAHFERQDRYPRDTDPLGVLLTLSAAAVLDDKTTVPVPGREDLLCREVASRSAEITTQQPDTELILGREAVMDQLLASARAALCEAAPTIATVVAEGGYGKSHLARALAQSFRLAAAPGQVPSEVIDLRARESIDGETSDLLRQLLQRVLDIIPGDIPVDGGRAHLVPAIGEDGGEAWPAIAETLGWLPAGSPELRALSAAPGVRRAIVIRVIADAIRRRARCQPLCIILDDSHCADDTTLDALERAALADTPIPLWICALGRPSFVGSRPAWSERAVRSARIDLGPLDPASAAQLCRHLLEPADSVPAKAIERIVERTQAIPLLLVELTRGLKRDGLVRRRPVGDGWFLATDELDHLPELPLVEWLTQREMDALPPNLAAHLRLIAILGAECWIDELKGVLEELEQEGAAAEFPLDAGAATERLVAIGLLVRHRSGSISFRHGLFRDAVVRSIPEVMRRRIHPPAYRFYRDSTGIPDGRRLACLAYHAAAAGMRAAAAATYLDLAERARSRHEYIVAEGLYSRALDLQEGSDERPRLIGYRGRGVMRYRIARYEDALGDFARAREIACGLDDAQAEVEILLEEATALDWMNDYHRSGLLNEQAQARAYGLRSVAIDGERSASLRAIEAHLLMATGRKLFRDGKRAEACAVLEQAVALADRLDDEGYEVLVVSLLLLQVMLPDLNRIADATSLSERVIALCRERVDLLHLGSALNNRRNVWIARKDLAAAIADQQSFMRIGAELGMVGWTYFGEYNVGEMLFQSGDLSAAAAHIARAVALEQRHPEVAPRPVAALLQARLLCYQGQAAEARLVIEGIRSRMTDHGRSGASDPLLSPSEEVLLDMVDQATQGASAEEWDRLCQRSASVSVEQEPIEVAEARALWAWRRGDVPQARACLERAIALAAQIPNLMEGRLHRMLAQLPVKPDGDPGQGP